MNIVESNQCQAIVAYHWRFLVSLFWFGGFILFKSTNYTTPCCFTLIQYPKLCFATETVYAFLEFIHVHVIPHMFYQNASPKEFQKLVSTFVGFTMSRCLRCPQSQHLSALISSKSPLRSSPIHHRFREKKGKKKDNTAVSPHFLHYSLKMVTVDPTPTKFVN